jgi:hypothetical protein
MGIVDIFATKSHRSFVGWIRMKGNWMAQKRTKERKSCDVRPEEAGRVLGRLA